MTDSKTGVIPTKKGTGSLPGWLPLLLFCVAAALFATLWGYNYSAGNAEEQLPFIFRALDPNFLTNDFFTNTFNQYGPRTIFTEFVAFIAGTIPLTTTLFILTLAANIAIAYLSGLVAKYFFPNSRFSHFLAAAGVLTLKTFWLGYSNVLYRNYLEPEHLAMPFILLGFYLILKRKPLISSICFGIAALFHALVGLEFGWILLGLTLLEWFIQIIRKETPALSLKSMIPAFLVMAAFSVGLLYPYTLQPSIPDSEFIRLVAYVRHPHHYLPSTFGITQYAQAGVYLLGFVLAFWLALKRSDRLANHKRYLLLIGGTIALLCLGGYLFVEVWPSRLWTSAQMFRLPFIIKWFSIVLLAAWAGEIIENPSDKQSRLFGITAAISLVTPASMAFVASIGWFREVLFPRWKLTTKLIDLSIFLASLAVIILYKPELRTWACYLILFAATGVVYLLKWSSRGLLLSALLPLAGSGLLLLFATLLTPPTFLKYDVPTFQLYKTTGDLADMAEYIRNNTPEDAIFYIPPRFGEFRYLARRAVVVDFSAYPFQDLAMREWFLRIAACYGISDKLGFDSLPQLNETVYHITNEELIALSEIYGFKYAVVYDSSQTNLPLVYRTKTLRLVSLP